MTPCQYIVDGRPCGFAARVRVVRAGAEGCPCTVAVCTLHAPEMFPIVAWEPIR